MRKMAIAGSIILIATVSSFAMEKGKELFIQKCATCHIMTFPKNKADLIAPPAPGVMYHMHQRFNSDGKILTYMRNFVMNPTTKTSLKKETKRFGLMPSQKGNITKEELNIITKWMVDNIHMSKKEHEKREQMYKKQKTGNK